MKLQKQSKDLKTIQGELMLIASDEFHKSDIINLKRASNITIESASKTKQISGLKKELGKGVVETGLVLILNQLKMYVKINVSDDWLFDWAETIVEDYWYLKFDELILALKQGATQKQYGEVLLSDVIGWINDYEEDRVKFHIERNSKHKENYDSNRRSEMTIKKYLDK